MSGTIVASGAASRRQRPDDVTIGTRLPVTKHSYGLAAAAVALITIVLPAASFYTVAHTIQAASLVKYGQLQLAMAVGDRAVRSRAVLDRQVQIGVTRLQEAREPFDRLGIYDRFFFHTEVAPATAAGTCRPDAPTVDDVPEGLEELLPFYSESSIGLARAHPRSRLRSALAMV